MRTIAYTITRRYLQMLPGNFHWQKYLALLPALWAFALPAQSGYEIMKKVEEQSRIHKTRNSDVYMQILDNKKRERERYFTHKSKYSSHISKSLIKFYKPPNVKGTALLTISEDKKADNRQWIWLPALKSLKQFNSEDKNKSFMGSDFTNSDIAGRELNRDSHKLDRQDKTFYYITSRPKNKKDIYSKLEVKVSRDILVPIEVKFYNRKGKRLKTLNNRKVSKVKGMYVVTETLMQNHKTKGQTLLKVSNIKVSIPISDNDVGIRGLRN